MAPLTRPESGLRDIPRMAPSLPERFTLIRRGLTRAAYDAAGSMFSKLRNAWSSSPPKPVPQFPEKPPEKFYQAPSWWSSLIFGSNDKPKTNREMIYGAGFRDRPVSNYADIEAMSSDLNKGRLAELRELKAQKIKEREKLGNKPKKSYSDRRKIDRIKGDIKGLEEEMEKLLRAAEEQVARLNRPEHYNAWGDLKKPDFHRGLGNSPQALGYNGESSGTQIPGAWIDTPLNGSPNSLQLDTNSKQPSITSDNVLRPEVDLVISDLLTGKPKVRFEEPVRRPTLETKAGQEKKEKDRKGKDREGAPVDWDKVWEEESDGDKPRKGSKGKKWSKKGGTRIITDEEFDSWTTKEYTNPHAVSAYNPEPDPSYTGEPLKPLLGWQLPKDSTSSVGHSKFNTKLSTAFGQHGYPEYDGMSDISSDSDMSNRVPPKKIDKGKGREFEPLPDSFDMTQDRLRILQPQPISYGSSGDSLPTKQRKVYPKERWPTAAEIPDDPDELLNPDGIPRQDPAIPVKTGKDWKEVTGLQVDTKTRGFRIESKSPVLPEVNTKHILSETANEREKADERMAEQEGGGITGGDSPLASYWIPTPESQSNAPSEIVAAITPHTSPVANNNGKDLPASKPRPATKPGNSLNQKYAENIELESLNGEETNLRPADVGSSGSSTTTPQVFVTPPENISPPASPKAVSVASSGKSIWNRLFGTFTSPPPVIAGPSTVRPAPVIAGPSTVRVSPVAVPDKAPGLETLVGLPELDPIPEDDFWTNAWVNPNPSDYVPVSGIDRKGKGRALVKRNDDSGHMYSDMSPMQMRQRLLGRAQVGARFDIAISCILSVCGVLFACIIVVAIMKAWRDRDECIDIDLPQSPPRPRRRLRRRRDDHDRV
ncbi:hypothetical protein K440DRAFT_659585 [Wilcoxina mikolae CBS 423.85]|nr:hypothetical protein K440DRAFT_659585 [Wilcoxina mikolae CBS 423.85]